MNRLAWLLAAMALAVAAVAQEPTGGETEPPAQQPAADDEVPFLDELPGEAGKDEAQPEPVLPAGEEETLPPPPPRSTGPTPQRFDPSEEVRADFPVSFPIDI